MARPLKVVVKNDEGVEDDSYANAEDIDVTDTVVTPAYVPPTIVKSAEPKVRIIALKTIRSTIGGVSYEIEKGKPYEFTGLVAAVLCNANAAART